LGNAEILSAEPAYSYSAHTSLPHIVGHFTCDLA
jgi:hypothetical protein